jgi:hypothetical protein
LPKISNKTLEIDKKFLRYVEELMKTLTLKPKEINGQQVTCGEWIRYVKVKMDICANCLIIETHFRKGIFTGSIYLFIRLTSPE